MIGDSSDKSITHKNNHGMLIAFLVVGLLIAGVVYLVTKKDENNNNGEDGNCPPGWNIDCCKDSCKECSGCKEFRGWECQEDIDQPCVYTGIPIAKTKELVKYTECEEIRNQCKTDGWSSACCQSKPTNDPQT